MNSKVELKNNAVYLNSKPVFIFSGEIHYFRIDKTDWKDRLKKAKQANLNTVSTYIPWIWHSPEEYSYDFKGKTCPERDIVSFIEYAKKEKLYFIARIGPICHGEITHDGLPAWLFKKYPEIKLKDKNGKTDPYSNLVDYSNPVYHKKIKNWYDKLIPVLKPYLFTNGGPIILIQLDNEISMLNWLAKAPNYSKYGTKLFQTFLKKKYGSIKEVNRNLNTAYRNFSNIKQPSGNFKKNKGTLFFDWAEYYREYYALYYKKLYSYFKSYKIDIPVAANIPQIYDYDVKGRGNMGIMTTSIFKKFSSYSTNNIIFGGAYQYRRLDYENFTDIPAMTEIVRMITPENNPVFCAEMQTGIMVDRPVLYPSDVELNIKTSTGSGLGGINCYMFAGGTNPEGIGWLGTHHNWQSAVSNTGQLAPHYYAVKECGQILNKFRNLIASAKIKHDINIGLYLPYYQTEYLEGDFIKKIFDRRDTNLFDGLLRLLKLAGYNYKFIDLKDTPADKLNQLDNLWVFSLEFMDMQTQKKIKDYLKKGNKKFFISPVIPVQNLNFQKCTLLRDYLGITGFVREPGSTLIKRPDDDFMYFGGSEIYKFNFSSKTEKNINPILLTQKNNICTFKFSKDNSDIIVCGFNLNHKFDFQIGFIEEFAHKLNIKKQVINKNKRINVLLRKSNTTDILFVSNYTEMPEKTNINLTENPYPSDMEIHVPPRKTLILLTNYKLTPDIKLHYAANEILNISRRKTRTCITIKNTGNPVDISFTGKKRIKTRAKTKILKKDKEFSVIRLFSEKDKIEIKLY